MRPLIEFAPGLDCFHGICDQMQLHHVSSNHVLKFRDCEGNLKNKTFSSTKRENPYVWVLY